ncbi:hypothetical protein FN846DRAFT_893348 [Sphaerosporella brunnea]|uniref:Uncharacterized protein n=1 Tax=Sphaerosporella brunnea TaxID=1250544 RepID=A0A5J5EMY1_9PEZI|nr:hypothetical protein FN846DRAFT_893348 [Sphaerosporella brunnea]
MKPQTNQPTTVAQENKLLDRVSRSVGGTPIGHNYQLPAAFRAFDLASLGPGTYSTRVAQVLPSFIIYVQLKDDVVTIAMESTVSTGHALAGFMTRLAHILPADEYRPFSMGFSLLTHDGIKVHRVHVNAADGERADDKFVEAVVQLDEGEKVFLQAEIRRI